MSRDRAGRKRKRRRTSGCSLLAALALSALSIVGCGGGASTAASSTAASSTAASVTTSASQTSRPPGKSRPHGSLVTQADAICERLKLALSAADRNAGGYDEAARGRLSALFATAEEKAIGQLAQLQPPASAAQEWQRLIAYRRALLGYHHKMSKYASHGETAGMESTYAAYKVAQTQLLEATKRSKLAFKVCSRTG